MEHFDISKGGSPLYLPIDDNINQWASLYNTRMHYRMLADRERQERNRLKADAMVKEIDKVLSFSPNNIFDGSEDNKLITDAISPYRNSIIDIKSRLLGGDLSALSDGANLLAQFTKVLDPNGNPIKSFSKQNYVLNQIQNNIKELLDPKSFTLDASRQYKAITNDLINKYNTGQIRLDQLVQGVQNIDKRGFRTLDHFIDLAKNIPLDELQSLSLDKMWKYDSKNPNKNKVAGVLLGAVNYVGGKDMDLFNFYKITKNKKGEEVREAISEEEYKKIVDANSKVSDNKLKVNVDALMKRDIRECTTLACRRVLGEVYPVIKGTSSTSTETKLHESQLKQDEYVHQKNVDKDYKVWEEKLNAKKAAIDVIKEQLKNKDLPAQQTNHLMVQLGIEEQKYLEMLRGNTAVVVQPVNLNYTFTKKDIEDAINNPHSTTGNRVADEIIEKHTQRTKLFVNINDQEKTVEDITNKIIKYNKQYFDKLNVKGNGKEALKRVILKGLETLKNRKVKGNNGNVNYTQVLEAGRDADISKLIGNKKSDYKKVYDAANSDMFSQGITPIDLNWNSIGADIKRLDQDDLDKTLKRVNALSSPKVPENISFTVLSNQASDAIVKDRMNSHGALFIATSTVEGDKPITLQGKTVLGITQYGVSKSGNPVFKVNYFDEKENNKTDIFVYRSKDAGLFVDGINSFERTSQEEFPKVYKNIDYTDSKNYTYEQNRVLRELNEKVKDVIKDRNLDKQNNSDDYKEDNTDNSNSDEYSYDIRYGNNTIKISISKDDHGNLTNQYTASTVINGKEIKVLLTTDMTLKQKNQLIYENLLTLKGLKRLLQKQENNGRRKPR